MATQLEAFRFIVPEMQSKTDTEVLQALNIATQFLNLDIIPDNVQGLALVYKAASLLHERGRNMASSSAMAAANGTFISSKKEGDVEVQYKESGGESRGGANVALNGYESQLAALLPTGGFMFTRFGLPKVS